MLSQLPTLQKLIRQLQRVPYLASKNVYRVAAHFLHADQRQVEALCQAIMDAKEHIHHCKRCFNWTEQDELCSLCSSVKRDASVVCVVETWHDVWALENVGDYQGLYHVLGGALCPLEGIGPDKLTIKPLLERIESEPIQEIIFATNPTPEGEATASYIHSKMKHYPIHVSRLASGVPTGASLEFMDRVTLSRALQGRRPF